MKKNLTMQLLPLWLLAIFLFASKPVGAQSYTYSEATPKVGIIKQIGCGTGNKADKAQIQVIHDGVGYSYNFGANATDVSNNTAWVPAGAQTIVVSKGGTTYNLPITVPAKVTPSFTPVITYNCNGTADVRLTNNQGTYNYTYTYGGSTHNSPYFRGLAVGQHTITVKYTATTTTRDIVFYDDFGVKPTGGDKAVRSKYAISTMNFAPLNNTQVKPDGTVLTGKNLTNDACYTVATKADADTEGSPGIWLYPNDKDGNANGRYLYYDAHTADQNLYTRKAKVTPNTPINFSAYLFNTVKTSFNATYKVRVTLDIYATEADAKARTNRLFTSYAYDVPTAGTNPNEWHPMNVTANIGGGYSELVFVVRMYGTSGGGLGNDIALDNILVTQPTTTCEQTVAVPVNIIGNAYSTTVTYNCAANNATVVVTPSVTTGYTYTYKLDNGVAGSVNTFNNVAVGVHTLTVTSRYTGATVKEIFKEDFGTGAPYSLPETVVPKDFVCKDVLYGFPADILPEGHYQVANRENLTKNTLWSWVNPKDHTNSGDSKGRYLAFNYGANGGKVFYQQDIKVEANKPVTVEYYLYSLNSGNVAQKPIIKAVLVNKTTGTAVHTSSQYYLAGSTNDTDWKEISFTFTPTVSDLQLRLINDNNQINANDFAIDDILITQGAYETCASTITATVAPKVTQAFAGVTKLIGCGTGASVNKAEVTIANVQGGTAYEYNFDGTWTTTNIGWLPAGTHTVSVRAAGTGNSCAYDMSVTVPNPIAQPTIKTEVFYSCDGKAILNVGVANPDPELKYLYSLDGAAYTTTYVYTNVASGTHSVSVQYEYRNAPSPVMLLKETFGRPTSAHQLPAGTTDVPYGVNMGHYQISNPTLSAAWGNIPATDGCSESKIWVKALDHTSNGTDMQGGFYIVDANPSMLNGELYYKKKVTNIAPYSDIKYEFYVLNLFREDKKINGGIDALKPKLEVRLVNNSNQVIGTPLKTGELPNSTCGTGMSNWRKIEGVLNVGNNTEFTIEFRSDGGAPHGWGNDFVLDDITVYQVPKACGQVVSTTKVVTANNQDIPAFTVSKTYDCATGKGALTVTPTATTGFTYTYTLGSTTYTSTTATFTGLDLEQTYTVTVNYQAVSNTVTLLNEDFGVGTTATDAVKSPYIGEDWYFNKNTTESYSTSNGKGQSKVHPANKYLDNQEYTIAPEFILNSNSNDWMKPVDKSGNANGRKLFVDGHATLTTEANLYLREIGVLPNQPLTFTTDFFNVISLAKTAAANNPIVQPQVRLQLYESEKAFKDGNAPLKQTNIYHVPAGSTATVADWKTQTLTLSSTEVGNRTKLFAVIKMYNLQHSGHDLAVDNIVITQKLSACATTVTATLTKGDVATPTLTLPANLTVVCSAPTASATISSWIASAVATSTCGTATVTHNYVAPANLCNVSGNAVSVTFTTTDAFGNVTTGTRVITFGTMTLTVTPTALSVPNGATGGTTSSVVPNITLGGVASPSTNSVTITFSGLPTGVTTNTNGQLVIPAGTPAGTHTITYRVCETAGHNNCKTVTTTLVIGAATPTVSTETFTASTTTATVVPGVIGNILTNATVGTQSATVGVGGNVTITLTHTPTTPNAPVLDPSTGNVTVGGNTPPGVYTITYNLCSAVSTCVPGVATVTVPQLKPYVPNTTITHSGTTTTTRNILDGATVNGGTQSATVGVGGTVSITNVTNPTPQTPGAPVPTLNPSTGIVTVPPTTPSGTYTISYTVCTTATPTNCTTGVTTVVVSNVTPTVVPDGFTASTTTATVVPGVIGNVLTNDRVGTQSATVGVGGNVTINVTHTPTTPNAPVLDPSTGNVTVGSNTPAGVYTISYQVCSGAACTPATVTVTVPQLKPYVPNTTITHSGTTTTTRNILDGATVNGGTQSATVGVGGTVSITNVTNPTPQTPGAPVPTLNPSTGIVTVPPTTPSGTYTISYTVCTTATPTNCTTGVTTVVVGNVTPTVVPDGFTASTTTATVVPGVIGNVLTNDRVGTQSATVGVGGNVTINVTHTPTTPNAPVLDPSTGNVTVGGNTPAGVYTISYQVCSGAACTPATVTVTVPQLKPYVPNTTITHSGTTTTTRNILDGATVNGGTQSATVGVGGTVSITNVTNPTPQTPGAPVPTLNPSTGIVTVPPTTPSGVYTISYTVCTTATPTNCTTGVTTVVVGNVTPTVVPDGFTASTTTATVVPGVIGNVLTNDRVGTQSATVGVGGNVTINVTHTPTTPNAPVLDPSTGNVTVGGNTPAGVYTISYQVCSGAACTPATVTVTVPQLKPYVPNTTITHSGTTTTTRNILDGATVNGGTQSATVGVGGTVSITNVTNPTPQTPGAPVPTLNPSTGIVTVPPTTPSGVYTISYTVCTTATPTNCTTGVTTVVVGNVTPTVVPDGFTASTTTATVVPGVIGNVLTNDRVGTQSATVGVGGNVTINVTHTPTTPNAPVLDPSTGNVTVGGNTPAGVYTISYQVCSGAACTPATVTVTVPQLKPYVPNTTITHSGTTTTTRNILDGATVNGGTQSATVGVGGTVSITNVTNPTPQTPGAPVPTLNPLTGIVTVPPTTPSGVYTISYTVCTTATPTNCTTGVTTVVVGNVTPTVVPDGFTASTTTATVVPGVIGNVLTNDRVGTQSATVGVGGNVTINVTHTPTTPNAPVLDPSTGNVTVGSNTPAGVYTISYQVCSGAACTPATVTVTVPQLKPYVPNTTITHSGTTTTTRNILDGATVNGGTQSATVGVGGTVSITNVTNPTPQTPGAPVPTLNPSTGIVTVPPTTPSGVYTISYTVCTTATPTNCTTGVTTVVVGNVTPTVVPDGFTASTTTATVVPGVIGNVLTNDRVGTQSATVGVGGNVTINVTHTPTTPNAPVLDPSTGNVTVGGNTPAGVYTISYQVCSGAACTPATVTVTVPQLKPYVPNTTITHSGTTTTTRNILDGATVNGGTQSATVGVGGTVSITNVTNPTPQTPGAPVPTLNPLTGIVTVPPTTPSGVYTISYTVCTTATPTNCTTGVTTVVVSNVTPTVVPSATNVTAHTRVNTPVNIGVTSSTTVTVSIPSQPANGTAVDNGDGTITYTPNNGFKGIDSFEYRLCNASGCHTATISVRVTNELVIYTGVSVGGDKNNHFHIEGIENYPNNIVRIYNRWGVKVFEVSGYNNTTKVFKGVSDARATLEASDNLPQGTYYYIIEYHDEANKKQTEVGWLYLKKN